MSQNDCCSQSSSIPHCSDSLCQVTVSLFLLLQRCLGSKCCPSRKFLSAVAFPSICYYEMLHCNIFGKVVLTLESLWILLFYFGKVNWGSWTHAEGNRSKASQQSSQLDLFGAPKLQDCSPLKRDLKYSSNGTYCSRSLEDTCSTTTQRVSAG